MVRKAPDFSSGLVGTAGLTLKIAAAIAFQNLFYSHKP